MYAMKNSLILFLFGLIIISYGCPQEPDPLLGGNLELLFETDFDGEQFFTGQEYTFPNGRKVKFSKIDFFVSGASARVDNGNVGETVDLSEVEFMDLTGSAINPVDPQDAMINSINLPSGDYTSLSFTLGLTSDLNAKTPNDSDLGTENPLKRSSHYWTDWTSYIFMKVEGNADFNGDGMIQGDETFVYHTGQSGFEQLVNLSSDFGIFEEQTTTAKVGVNLRSFFFDDAGVERFDMNNLRSVHTDITVIETIMKGAAEGMTMKN